MRTLVYLASAVLVVSCGKKADDEKPAPDPKATTPDKPVEPAKPVAAATTTVPVTSKSPDAIKLFEQGRDLTDSERGAEAVEPFKKAIELDPDFAQAHAYLGILTQGPPGMAELDKAKTLAAKLPESEHLVIEGAHASRRGDHAAMLAAYTKVSELAPGDWRIWLTLGWERSTPAIPRRR